MVFKRYSSPFLFLENLIENKKFYDGIITIWNKSNDDKLWELYLHSMPEKSFNDWKDELIFNNNKEEVSGVIDLEVAKEKSRDILNHFKPE